MDYPLPVAVIGAGGFGSWTLRALQRSPLVRIVAVGDKDQSVAVRAAADVGAAAYSDNRSLLAEAKPAAVFLAVPPMAAAEILTLCIDRGIHVWKEMPLARRLDEAAAFVLAAEKAGVKFAVGTQRRFFRGYRRAYELRQRLGPIFLGRSHYLFNWGPRLTWRGDRASAGGGALMELGYPFVDLLVWMLGLPDAVYGLSASGRRAEKLAPEDKLQPPYDTDDTAAAILRYNSGLMATVVATRASGPISEELSLHGRGGSLQANSEMALLRNPDGEVLDQVHEDSDPLAVFVRQVETFVRAVRDETATYECSARENLLNLAVIDAIYLSDRTAQPESPLHRLKIHGLDLNECLAMRPAGQ